MRVLLNLFVSRGDKEVLNKRWGSVKRSEYLCVGSFGTRHASGREYMCAARMGGTKCEELQAQDGAH